MAQRFLKQKPKLSIGKSSALIPIQNEAGLTAYSFDISVTLKNRAAKKVWKQKLVNI